MVAGVTQIKCSRQAAIGLKVWTELERSEHGFRSEFLSK
jgi:hypothetical protein